MLSLLVLSLVSGPAHAQHDTLPVIQRGSAAVQVDPSTMGPAKLSISADGDSLTLEGPIGPGTSAKFADILPFAPQLRLLRLNSPGGMVNEARKIAALVKVANLETYVEQGCASACTMIFYAGRVRWIRPDALLGFHSYSNAGHHKASAEDINAVEDVERKSFAHKGLPTWFINRIFATPSTAIWMPTSQELLASHFATDMTVDETPIKNPQADPDGMPSINRPVTTDASPLPKVVGP